MVGTKTAYNIRIKIEFMSIITPEDRINALVARSACAVSYISGPHMFRKAVRCKDDIASTML